MIWYDTFTIYEIQICIYLLRKSFVIHHAKHGADLVGPISCYIIATIAATDDVIVVNYIIFNI